MILIPPLGDDLCLAGSRRHKYTQIHTYTFTHIHTRTHTHIHTHTTHTHTHTHTLTQHTILSARDDLRLVGQKTTHTHNTHTHTHTHTHKQTTQHNTTTYIPPFKWAHITYCVSMTMPSACVMICVLSGRKQNTHNNTHTHTHTHTQNTPSLFYPAHSPCVDDNAICLCDDLRLVRSCQYGQAVGSHCQGRAGKVCVVCV